jgi:DNA-binding CsgD family transcriptional regulator
MTQTLKGAFMENSGDVLSFNQQLRVKVISPSHILRAGLCEILEKHGFSISVDKAHVDLIDLSALVPPYSVPDPTTPALALIRGFEYELRAAVSVGYKGYLTQDAEVPLLLKALKALARGEVWIERKVMMDLYDQEKQSKITRRELEVHNLLSQGLSNQEIATNLGVSISTVKAHITGLLNKFNAKSRLELVTKYSQHNHHK